MLSSCNLPRSGLVQQLFGWICSRWLAAPRCPSKIPQLIEGVAEIRLAANCLAFAQKGELIIGGSAYDEFIGLQSVGWAADSVRATVEHLGINHAGSDGMATLE
jgi:hypothetical protein